MLQQVAALVGRLLICPVFLMSGFMKITNWSSTAEFMRNEGMELVPLLLIGAIVIEIVGGLSLLLGWWARLGALALIIFLIPTTLIFHDFWTYSDPQARMLETMQFTKNVTIMGGLFAFVGLGPGWLSVDGWHKLRKTDV